MEWYTSEDFTNIDNRIDFANPPTGTVSIYSKFVDSTGYVIDEKGVLTKIPDITTVVEIPYNVNQITVNKIKSKFPYTFFGGSYSDGVGWRVTKIYLPTLGLEEIGEEVFQYSSKLTSIKITNTVVRIGDQSFNNVGLTSITIPSSVTNIGAWSFNYNTKLKTLRVERVTPPTLGENAFSRTACQSKDYGALGERCRIQSGCRLEGA